jgi:membrane-associated protease RseP (regulator of RpoE activity)
MNPQLWGWYGGAFIVALAVLVVVHEMGHYLAARACNVKVLRFAFGFGKVIWMRRKGSRWHGVGDLGVSARRLRQDARRT